MTNEQIKLLLNVLVEKIKQLNIVSNDPFGKLCLMLYDDGGGMIGTVGNLRSSDQMEILCDFASLEQAADYLAKLQEKV